MSIIGGVHVRSLCVITDTKHGALCPVFLSLPLLGLHLTSWKDLITNNTGLFDSAELEFLVETSKWQHLDHKPSS